MKIVIATTNTGKLEELKALLPEHVKLMSLADIGLDPPPETGTSFIENARIKALSAAQSGFVTIADDSGLVFDDLNGAPGVNSSRFAGANATDADNNCHLIAQLSVLNKLIFPARFSSAVVLISKDNSEYSAEGHVDGRIILSPRGEHGFGYDPHFEINDDEAPQFVGRTMAELAPQEKNVISHRARAVKNLLCSMRNSNTFDQVFIPHFHHDSGVDIK